MNGARMKKFNPRAPRPTSKRNKEDYTSRLNSETFDGEGYGVAAAEAQRGNATFQIASLQFVQESDQDARPAGADRMTDGHCAAVDVHFFGIEFQLARDGDGGDGEGFIELDEVNVLIAGPACFREQFFDGIDRSHHHPLRFDATDSLRNDSSDRSLAKARGVPLTGDNQRGGAVVGSGSISRGDGA